MQIAALVIATIIPALFLFVIYKLDLYKIGAFRYVLTCFVAGIFAFGVAFLLNRTMIGQGMITQQNMVRYSAPIIEEVLKALILIYLIRKPDFTYFVDGAIYGFSAGIGFAIIENYQYVLASSAGLTLAASRVLSTNLVHASASALIGIAFGLARFEKSTKKVMFILVGLFFAIILHMGFNNIVTRVDNGLMMLIYAVVVGIASGSFIVYMMKRGLVDQKAWIEEKLGVADRVTDREVAVVQRLSDVKELLAPVAERFGPEKAVQSEKFLVLQAQLGIKRKTLDKLTDEKMKIAVQTQMDAIRNEMDDARKAVGSYCMLYIRNIFPDDASPLWGRLEYAIEERAAARPKSGGMNLWATLDKRTAKKTDDGNKKQDAGQ